MITKILIIIVLMLFLVSCSKGNNTSPSLQDTQTGERLASVFTVSFNPSVILQDGYREGADHDTYITILENTHYPTQALFNIDAELKDYDRGTSVLDVEFKIQYTNEEVPMFDPRILFYFNDVNGICNEPGDDYRLENADLLFNFGLDYQPWIGTYIPALRVMPPNEYFVEPLFEYTVPAKIKIPRYDQTDNFINYQPVQWTMVLEATRIPLLFRPHVDPIDIVDQSADECNAIFEKGNSARSSYVKCTVVTGFIMNPMYYPRVELNATSLGYANPINMVPVTVTNAGLVMFHEFSTPYPLSGYNISDPIDTDTPVNLRFTATTPGFTWKIQDDLNCWVIPDSSGYDTPDNGFYNVVYLEYDPQSHREEFRVVNTLTKEIIKLSGPGGVASGLSLLDNYVDFRNLSIATIQPFPGNGARMRLVFEGDYQDPYEPHHPLPPYEPWRPYEIDIIGLQLAFNGDGNLIGANFVEIAEGLYEYDGSIYKAIERNPQISSDGLYVVYEREERVEINGEIHDRPRIWMVRFAAGNPTIEPYEIMQFAGSGLTPQYTASQPTIAVVEPGRYLISGIVDYIFNVSQTIGYPGRGMIATVAMQNDVFTNISQVYQGAANAGEFNIFAPNLAKSPRSSTRYGLVYLSEEATGMNIGYVEVIDSLLSPTYSDPSNIDIIPRGLFIYHPEISQYVDFYTDPGLMHYRVVYRSGNDKNADVRLHFFFPASPLNPIVCDYSLSDQEMYDELFGLYDFSEFWRDDRSHDNDQDISTDGNAVVWCSHKYSSSDVYLLDLRHIGPNQQGQYLTESNAELMANTIRLTTTGCTTEPQVSDFILLSSN
jgi:hypothetical protein